MEKLIHKNLPRYGTVWYGTGTVRGVRYGTLRFAYERLRIRLVGVLAHEMLNIVLQNLYHVIGYYRNYLTGTVCGTHWQDRPHTSVLGNQIKQPLCESVYMVRYFFTCNVGYGTPVHCRFQSNTYQYLAVPFHVINFFSSFNFRLMLGRNF
jgi:hypothetical protein